jgi:gluconate 5-dehydrogenase
MSNVWRPLAGMVALMTGAGRGLGYGVARALGRAGASECLTDVNCDELACAAAEVAGRIPTTQ